MKYKTFVGLVLVLMVITAFFWLQKSAVVAPVVAPRGEESAPVTTREKTVMDNSQPIEITTVPQGLEASLVADLGAYAEDGMKQNSLGKTIQSQLCKGAETNTLADFGVTLFSLDVNNDSVSEVIAEPESVCKSVGYFRGAAGNGPYFVYQKNGTTWKQIGSLFGNSVTRGVGEKNGYSNLETGAHLSSTESFVTTYTWNPEKGEYESN